MFFDKLTSNKEHVAYARVLVKLKYDEMVINSIKLKGLAGKMFTQRIVYEVRPSFAMLSMFEFWSGEE